MSTLMNLQHRLEKIGDGIREVVQKKKKEPVFGRHIDSFVDAELLEGVPIPVYRSIEHLCKNGYLDESGLFRIAAVQSEVKNVRALYDKGLDPDLLDIAPDPHVSTNLLKMYFRELPEPLLTYELYDCFIAANSIPVQQSRLECIKKIIGYLPPRNYTLLVYLVKFLIIITAHSSANKMTSSNLATVFAPNLLKSPNDDVQTTIEDQPHASSMMQTMIDDFGFLFKEIKDEKFDFEYYSKGETPPTPASLPVSPRHSEDNKKGVRQSVSVAQLQQEKEKEKHAQSVANANFYSPRPLPESPNPPAPYQPHTSLKKVPSDKKAPPPKPPRKDSDPDEEEDEENRVQIRVLKRPPPRPLTILESPPVRTANRAEVEQLTEEFTRLSQYLSAGDDIPTSAPPKIKPPMPPKPQISSKTSPSYATSSSSSPGDIKPVKAAISAFEHNSPNQSFNSGGTQIQRSHSSGSSSSSNLNSPSNINSIGGGGSKEQVSEQGQPKYRQNPTPRKVENKNFVSSDGVILASVTRK